MKRHLYTIAAHLPFADTLAGWCLTRWGGSPLTLSRALILLPTRRAARSLREAFLRAGGGAPMLLPRIETLGDADEDALLALPHGALPEEAPPEDFAYRRLFLLSRLVRRHQELVQGHALPMDHALKLSAELARLLDECEREEVPLTRMADIVPAAFAQHWQVTVEFLRILSEHWPNVAAEQELVSPGAYQSRVLRRLAEAWRAAPPPHPVIAAGTTGSVPATANLLAAVASLPDGHIILPGLDLQADDDYFTSLDEGHPQWGMAQLLAKFGCDRRDVAEIGAPAGGRERLLSEVMRPAELSDAWRNFRPDKKALTGMTVLDCANLQEEATACALLLRETLEEPGRTAALVTHNRGLARRVAGIMRRFGVEIDDSAGQPLLETPLAAFLRLILEAAAEELAPLPLISLLKHPLCYAGMDRMECLEAARELERLALRGLRSRGGVNGLRDRLVRQPEDVPPAVHTLLDSLANAFAPLLEILAVKEVSLSGCIDAHLACAQLLGHEEMWSGQEGEVLSDCLAAARSASEAAPLTLDAASYPGIFDELLAGKVVRPEYGMHPRLKILSPMEARMQSFDRIILGGLNEGSWPPAPKADPWFSRPMRAAIGLPSPERRLGLAAHDFSMLAAAPEVYLTRAGKEGGAPAQASRWLVKLAMLSGGIPGRGELIHWAQVLDMPEAVTPMVPPAALPPLSARPKSLSVTKIDTWVRDPYALYASQVLRLAALKPLGREADASDFGNAVHKALERFVRAHPGELPNDALPVLLGFGREAFHEMFAASSMEVLWWPRFTRIAAWIIAQEQERKKIELALAEQDGSMTLDGFELHGRADRIERYADGGMAIIDYKTGSVPTMKDIERGLSNQLVLLALIAEEDGFGVKGSIDSLEYWQLQGGQEAGEVTYVDPKKMRGFIDAARTGLRELIARYRDPSFPYRSVPIPTRAQRYSDFVHLARIKEWG